MGHLRTRLGRAALPALLAVACFGLAASGPAGEDVTSAQAMAVKGGCFWYTVYTGGACGTGCLNSNYKYGTGTCSTRLSTGWSCAPCAGTYDTEKQCL